MKKTYTLILLISLTISFCLPIQAETVTYTVASTTSVTTSGTAPTGSSATFKNTYTTANQMTKDNSTTLTLSGFGGYKITGIVLSMKSNNKAGSGTFSAIVGTTTIAKISSATAFNSWYDNTEYSSSYKDVTVTLTNSNCAIGTSDVVTITIACTVNSLYIQSYTITYEQACTKPEFSISNKTITLTEASDIYDMSGLSINKGGSTGAITYSCDDEDNVEIEGSNFLTGSAGTYTINATMAADETYCEATTSFTIKVIDPSAPKYTITWSAPNSTETTTVTQGDALDLPTTDPTSCSETYTHFVGWFTQPAGTEDNPTTLPATQVTASTIPTANTTYYAVFSDETTGAVANWQLVTSESDLIAGATYTLSSSSDKTGKFLSTKADNNYKADDWSSSTATPVKLTLGGVAGSWTFYDTANKGYLYAASSSKNYLRVQTTNDANGQWTIAIGIGSAATITAQGTNADRKSVV